MEATKRVIRTDEFFREIYKEFKSGESINDLAVKHGIHSSTIYYRCEKLGLKFNAPAKVHGAVKRKKYLPIEVPLNQTRPTPQPSRQAGRVAIIVGSPDDVKAVVEGLWK